MRTDKLFKNIWAWVFLGCSNIKGPYIYLFILKEEMDLDYRSYLLSIAIMRSQIKPNEICYLIIFHYNNNNKTSNYSQNREASDYKKVSKSYYSIFYLTNSDDSSNS